MFPDGRITPLGIAEAPPAPPEPATEAVTEAAMAVEDCVPLTPSGERIKNYASKSNVAKGI